MRVGFACFATSASANTKGRIVVIDFDGPRALAEPARDVVVNALSSRYELVSVFWWQAVTMATSNRGPVTWRKAAIAMRTDVVVEGWTDPTAAGTNLVVAVRDALTGSQVDLVAVLIADSGAISADDTRTLVSKLDAVIDREHDEIQALCLDNRD